MTSLTPRFMLQSAKMCGAIAWRNIAAAAKTVVRPVGPVSLGPKFDPRLRSLFALSHIPSKGGRLTMSGSVQALSPKVFLLRRKKADLRNQAAFAASDSRLASGLTQAASPATAARATRPQGWNIR